MEAVRPFLPLAEIAEEELAYDLQQQRQNLASDEMLLHIEENHRPQKDNYYEIGNEPITLSKTRVFQRQSTEI